MRKILVPIRGDGRGEGVIRHAAAIGRAHHAHIVVLHCRTRAADMIPRGMVVPQVLREQILRQAEGLANAEEGHLQDKLTALCGALGAEIVADGAPHPDGLCVTWHEEAGKQANLISLHGRLADLVVVSKPDRDRNLGVNSLNSAIFETGRPVLLCPSTEPIPTVLGRHVAIAWNGTVEVARAVALSLSVIASADTVTILDGGAEHPVTSAKALASYLLHRGIKAKIIAISASDDPGPTILGAVHDVGADLLIMGAYGHSRTRETVLGGATQFVVDTTACPVLMVH
ncbi:MAG: universal stress protein [Pseudomonadota bacterium]